MALDEDGAKLLEDSVYVFLTAGGQLTWEKWQTLSDQSRQAFAAAGHRIKMETALTIIDVLTKEEIKSGD